jgi:cardiolipin synthase
MGHKRSSHPTSLPNVLTASRIAAAPLLAVAVLTGQEPWIAAAIVLFAALTDLFDGIVARAQGQLSELGAVLDPIADKIFVISALFLLVADGLLSGATVVAVLIIVWRELLISGLRDYARFIGFPAPVSRLAKIKTAAQFASLLLLYAARVPTRNSEVLAEAGDGLLWVASGLTLYTGGNYLWHTWRQTWK